MNEQTAVVEQVGTSYRVLVEPLGGEFMFRDVVADGELRADVTVAHRGTHLFRSTTTLSLTGRDRIAKTAAELDSGDGEGWRRGTFAATEAVLTAVEGLGENADLRFAETGGHSIPAVIDEFWPKGPMLLVAPAEFGKSTIGRATALSVASGKEIIPGLRPIMVGPVLYVAAEDPVAQFHARNLEAIARGAKMDRAKVEHPITLFDSRGRSLHRTARALAERAQDCAAVILDSHQALLGPADDGGIRDRDSLFWNAVDQIERPTLILGHPNRADRQHWGKADGSLAGTDVNRDRARASWRGRWQDGEKTLLESTRRYTLDCTKFNHGPRFRPISFAAHWTFTYETGSVLKYETSEPVRDEDADGSPEQRETVAAYRAGAKTGPMLAAALGISLATAQKRLQRYRAELGD